MARTSKIEVEKERERARKGKGGRGIYSQNHQVWEAVVALLVAIVGYVRIDDERYDDILLILGALVWERSEVREVMERVNRDAVWLHLQVAGRNRRLEVPRLEGYEFAKLGDGIVV